MYRGIVAAAVIGFGVNSKGQVTQKLALDLLRDESTLSQLGPVTASYADIVEKMNDSVVTIEVVRHEKTADPATSFDLEAPPAEAEEDQVSGGSGVILTKRGLILTNSHVVRGASIIHVLMKDHQESVKVEIVGQDPMTDVALLALPVGRDYKNAVFGDSSKLRAGDVVLAIGSPFGLDQSITLGVVSGIGRGNVGVIDSGMEDFIQTDAAINPGNSGGPLVDCFGRVVGINTGRYAGDNIGFAIPINLALKISSDLAADGRVNRGYLGVTLRRLTKILRTALGLSSNIAGVAIEEVATGSPAEQQGILPGDVIMKVNTFRTNSVGRLNLAMALLQPGTVAELLLLRNGQQVLKSIRLGDPPGRLVSALVGTNVVKGLRVAELTENLRAQFDLPEDAIGLVVLANFGENGGVPKIKAGEVLSAVNGEEVLLSSELISALSHHRGQNITLKIIGKQGPRFLTILLE